MSTSNEPQQQSIGARLESWKQQAKTKLNTAYETTKRDVWDFAKDRPVLTALLAFETAGWIAKGVRKYLKRHIWWNTVLELELKGDYNMKRSDPLDEIFNPPTSLSFKQLLDAIYFAARDWRIRALFIRMDGEFTMGAAQYEELRRTLINFKMFSLSKGKPAKKIIVYADSFGGYGSNAIAKYYLATAADKIYLPSVGNFFVGPITIDGMFLKGTLEKLDMSFEVRRRAEFKNAANPLISNKYDKFHKKQYSDLIACMEYSYIQTIALARKLKPFSTVSFDSINKTTLNANEDDDSNSLLKQSDNWSYLNNQLVNNNNNNNNEFKFNLDDSITFAVKEILKMNNELSFEGQPDEEDGNDYKEDSEITKDKFNELIRCWSDKVGDYNNPQLYLILQFLNKKTFKPIFYECVVAYPTLNQTKGRLQDKGMIEPPQLATAITNPSGDGSDGSGNGTAGNTDDSYILLSSRQLPTFSSSNPSNFGKYKLMKPEDVQIPESDRQKDINFGLEKVVDEINNKTNIEIDRNVTEILHYGSYLPQEALDLGLIDGIKYYAQMYEEVIPNLLGFEKLETGNVFKKQEKLEKSKISYLYIKRYYERCVAGLPQLGIIGDDWIYSPISQKSCYNPNIQENKSFVQKVVSNVTQAFQTESTVKIAYIRAHGAIMDGESDGDNLGSKSLIRAFRATRARNKKIKGIILHIDSPGGAATACENMYREIEKCRKFGMPVVGIQQNIAASGGYYLSAPCDWVISSNYTITGSIGIIAGKFRTRDFWKNKLGISYDRLSRNLDNAEQFSQLDGIGSYERIRMEKLLTQWYYGFKSVISEPRHISMENVETVAKGQVWCGSKAHEFGLVDEIGGIWEAIRKVKELVYINKIKNNKKFDGNIPNINEIQKRVKKQRVKLVNPLGKPTLSDIFFGEPVEHENDFRRPRGSISTLETISLVKEAIEWSTLARMTMNIVSCISGVNTNSLVSSLMFANGINASVGAVGVGFDNINGMNNINNMKSVKTISPVLNRLEMISKEISLCCGMDAIDKCEQSRVNSAAFYTPGLSYISKQLEM